MDVDDQLSKRRGEVWFEFQCVTADDLRDIFRVDKTCVKFTQKGLQFKTFQPHLVSQMSPDEKDALPLDKQGQMLLKTPCSARDIAGVCKGPFGHFVSVYTEELQAVMSDARDALELSGQVDGGAGIGPAERLPGVPIGKSPSPKLLSTFLGLCVQEQTIDSTAQADVAEGSKPRTRLDAVARVIADAQRSCCDPNDPAEVWGVLCSMPREDTGTFFIGFTGEALLYGGTSKGKVANKELNFKMIGDRLRRRRQGVVAGKNRV